MKEIKEEGSEILEKIVIAIDADNIEDIAKLVEKAFDEGCAAKEIKDSIRILMERPKFDTICEFCRAMHFEENRRTKREVKINGETKFKGNIERK